MDWVKREYSRLRAIMVSSFAAMRGRSFWYSMKNRCYLYSKRMKWEKQGTNRNA